MKIREKLTLQFSAIVGLILILFSCSIYYFSKEHRYDAFNVRLMEKALNTANLLIEVEEIDLDLLKKLRRDYLLSLPEEFVRVYDKNNKAVFKDDTISYEPPVSYLNEVRIKGEYDYKVDERQFVSITYKNDYVIIASARNINGPEELNYLAFLLISGNVICLVLLLIAGRIFAKHALKPISKMVQDVENMGEDNLSQRLDEGMKKDEISLLAITFNKLFRRVEDAFDRQRRFVANASHELRTPLTTITGEIEVALMKERSKEEYVEVLNSILEEAKSMTTLSNNLLKLIQMRNAKELLVKSISLLELLETIAEESYKRNSEAKLIFELESIDKLEDKFIEGHIDLLKVALYNIIDNAFKYSDYKPVLMRVDSDDKYYFISIMDHGIGMTEEDISFAFQPFYRSENVSAIQGSGVGLSLTNKIIKLHGGMVTIKSEIGVGTEVIVALPV